MIQHYSSQTIQKQELREPAIYNSILEAIANGTSRVNEISTKMFKISWNPSNNSPYTENCSMKSYYYAFSKSGFTDYVKENAPSSNIILITLDDLFNFRKN